MLKSIERMLSAFEQKGIIYCHWKSNEHLAEALTGETDLDVLFLPEQRALLEQTLNECGLKRFRGAPLMQYNAIEDFIGCDEVEGVIWHLHTHYRMTMGEKHLKGYTVTPWTKYILDNRVLDASGIYTSKVEVELVLLLARIAMKIRLRDKWGKLGKDDVVELTWLQERADKTEFGKHAKAMVGEDAATVMSSMIEKTLKSKMQFGKLRSILLKRLKPFTGYSSLGSRWARTKREFFWLVGGVSRRLGLNPSKAYRRVSPSGGCVVAFLGCDGAGKSTTLAYVKKEFGKKVDVKNVYLGSGDGSSSLLRKPMKMVAKRVGGKGLGHSVEKEYSNKKKVSMKARLYSIAKIMWAVTLAKEKKSKLREVTKARNAGMLVLIDRYPQIEVAGYSDGPLLTRYLKNGKGLFYKIAKWEYAIYESAYTNAPDLIIKLMVPTEVAIQRKPEMTAEEIDNKKAAVRAINAAPSVEIDTSCPKEVSLPMVMNEIWKII